VRIRLGQLEALVWIARLGSFRAAARRLNLSQPAISGRIRTLESQLGIDVVDRSQLRPSITRHGMDLVRYAEQMMQLGETIETRLRGKHSLVGTLRLGAADSFALTHLSGLLARIAAKHPALHVELDIDFSVNLDRKLHAEQLDVAFLNLPTPDPAITIVPLMDIELAWFASPKLKLPRSRVTPAHLARLSIVTNPRPSHLYRTVMDWFRAAGLTPQRLNTCNSLSIMTRLTLDGFGVAVLPPMLVSEEIRSGALRRLPSNPALPPHHLTVAYRNDPAIGDLSEIVGLVGAAAPDKKKLSNAIRI
jgi:DNA-binding transcriptional LysR family regulator